MEFKMLVPLWFLLLSCFVIDENAVATNRPITSPSVDGFVEGDGGIVAPDELAAVAFVAGATGIGEAGEGDTTW